MLVSAIISKGLSYAALPSTNFFTAQDQLDSVQQSYKDLYAVLCEHDDDYFVTQVYLTLAAFTPDANRAYTYNYPLPSDFYRLRLFQYQPDGQLYFPVDKMTIENFGNLQGNPGYRMQGQFLSLYTVNNYTNWCLWYYPAPATLTTLTDIVYPNSLIPEIMAWQVAIDARRKQNLDYQDKQARRDELFLSMVRQVQRDEARAESPRNIFGEGLGPYI